VDGTRLPAGTVAFLFTVQGGSGERSRTTAWALRSAAGCGTERHVRCTSDRVDGPQLETALAAGRSMSVDAAVEQALVSLD
jgi:hypothetical protein